MRSLLLAIVITTAGMTAVPAADFAVPPPPAANPFDGAYVGVGGSYGIGSPRNYFARVEAPVCCSSFSFGNEMSGRGWSGIAVAGVNLTYGPALVGFEFDGRWGDERATFSASGPLGAGSIRHQGDAGAHLALRFGLTSGNALIFGKVGVGAAHVRNTFSAQLFAFPPAVTLEESRWLASVLFGAGIEYNIGRAFVRLSGEAEMIPAYFGGGFKSLPNGGTFSGNDNGEFQWTSRIIGLVGMRF